uniref:Uncharacterized protein n=1 Tax=Panagrolaimus davidi TaxID=227884 RepID=A0A914P5B0_9BILA
MDYVLWNRREFIKLYNCSFFDIESVPLEKRQHPFIGMTLVIFFTVFEFLYIPSLLIMRKKQFYAQPCYKIMHFIGIVDVLSLSANAFTTGIFCLVGAVYCMYPSLIYGIGCIGLGKIGVNDSFKMDKIGLN